MHIHQWKMWCRKKLHLTWILPIASHNNAKSLASCWAFELHHHNSQGGIPPRVDCNVMKVNFFQRSCVFILLNPMEETNLFLVNYFSHWDLHSHKWYEQHSNLLRHYLSWTPWNWDLLHLSSRQLHSTSTKVYIKLHVLRLHITDSNGHYFVKDQVIGGKP